MANQMVATPEKKGNKQQHQQQLQQGGGEKGREAQQRTRLRAPWAWKCSTRPWTLCAACSHRRRLPRPWGEGERRREGEAVRRQRGWWLQRVRRRERRRRRRRRPWRAGGEKGIPRRGGGKRRRMGRNGATRAPSPSRQRLFFRGPDGTTSCSGSAARCWRASPPLPPPLPLPAGAPMATPLRLPHPPEEKHLRFQNREIIPRRGAPETRRGPQRGCLETAEPTGGRGAPRWRGGKNGRGVVVGGETRC